MEFITTWEARPVINLNAIAPRSAEVAAELRKISRPSGRDQFY